jgi:Tfp pilus assembly protein PilF
LSEAVQSVESGETESSDERVFMDGLDQFERCSQLLLGTAMCEVKLGSVDKTRKFFESAVRADKKHAQAWQAWGVMESRAGNITVAKTLLETGLKSSPRHGALWHAFGVLEGRMFNLQAARPGLTLNQVFESAPTTFLCIRDGQALR